MQPNMLSTVSILKCMCVRMRMRVRVRVRVRVEREWVCVCVIPLWRVAWVNSATVDSDKYSRLFNFYTPFIVPFTMRFVAHKQTLGVQRTKAIGMFSLQL